MPFFKRAFAKSFVAIVLVALSLFAFSGISSAYANTPQSHMSAHVSRNQVIFSHCPGTLRIYRMNSREKVCVVTVPNGGASSRPSTEYLYYATVCYFQNGPFGSNAWANGWGDCVDQYGGNPYYVPRKFNDQASSWDSYGSGTFYANQPYTNPYATYPANGQGNFPLANPPRLPVPNDSLSSIVINSPSEYWIVGTATTVYD